ncbi:MAG: hypothetical protein IJD02_01630 [Lachnospiraceae bacterium]|nr:hypothetical protein [Lachnospiraceae bacterium]
MKNKKTLKRGIALSLAATLVIGFIPMVPKSITKVQAADSNNTTKLIAGLGTDIIADPVVPANASDAWMGSYVYFGTYDTDGDSTAEPIKYRVLDSNTTVFSGDADYETMLLDCDSVLWTGDNPSSAFDADNNKWAESDIKAYLNGTFMTNSFSVAEQNVIAESTVASHVLTTDSADGVSVAEWTNNTFVNYVALDTDKVFLLDVEDVSNGAYGYSWTDNGASNRIKKDADGDAYNWWLRSANETNSYLAGSISSEGVIFISAVSNDGFWVSPALNINLSSVLFTSVISGTAGEIGAEYKLTIQDDNIDIACNGTVTRTGDTVTIPHTITGNNNGNVTQTSVLILDKAYTAGNTNNARVLFYDALDDNDSFTLPTSISDKMCGKDYYVYIIAEDENGAYETDYASAPVKINVPWFSKAINLGTDGITDPIVPTSTSDAWKGSYVYFGKYNGYVVKYRVLDSNTTVFSGNSNDATMLLDCNILFELSDLDIAYDEDNNVWADSDIRAYLNGTFLTSNFNKAEQDAIAPSVKNNVVSTDGEGWEKLSYVALNGDKIFFLDAKEATNESYGYSDTDMSAVNRVKIVRTGADGAWWLRSTYLYSDYGVGCVDMNGDVGNTGIANNSVGVSPSLNVNLSSILLSSACGTSKSMALTSGSDAIGKTTGTDWKLTLLDAGKTVQITENEKVTKATDGTITVPYTYTDNAVVNAEKVNQISVMITDKVYTESDAQIMYYGALQGTDFAAASGTGTFSLPSGLDGKEIGTDYHVYILAEHADQHYFTDYASEPVEIEVYNETLGVTVADIEEPIGGCALDMSAEVSSEAKTAHVTWMDGENEVTGNAKYNTAHTVKVTLSAIDGYAFTNNTEVTLNGNIVTTHRNNDGTLTASYTFPVTEMGTIAHTSTGYEGTYDGNAHLITVVVTEPESTTVTYSTDEGNNKTYSETNPVFTDAGTYTVYYKIENSDYITATGSQTVKINKKAVTVTAKDQTVTEGDGIDSSKYTVSGLLEDHSINKVTLIPSTNVATEDGSIEVHLDKIVDLAGEDVTANYEITLTEGKLVVVEEEETPDNSEEEEIPDGPEDEEDIDDSEDEEDTDDSEDEEGADDSEDEEGTAPDKEDENTTDNNGDGASSGDNSEDEDVMDEDTSSGANGTDNDKEDSSSDEGASSGNNGSGDDKEDASSKEDTSSKEDVSDDLDEVPSTGDNSNAMICVVLLAGSILSMVCFSRKRRHI